MDDWQGFNSEDYRQADVSFVYKVLLETHQIKSIATSCALKMAALAHVA